MTIELPLDADLGVIYKLEGRTPVRVPLNIEPHLYVVEVFIQRKLAAFKRNDPKANVVLFHTLAYNLVKNLSNTKEYENYRALRKRRLGSIEKHSAIPIMADNLVRFVVSEMASLRHPLPELIRLSEEDPYVLVRDYFWMHLQACPPTNRPILETLQKVMAVLKYHGPEPGKKGKWRGQPPPRCGFSDYFAYPSDTIRSALAAVDAHPKRYTVDASIADFPEAPKRQRPRTRDSSLLPFVFFKRNQR